MTKQAPLGVAGKQVDCGPDVVAHVLVNGSKVLVIGRRHAVNAVVYAVCGGETKPLGYSLGPGVETGVLEDGE